MKKPIELEDIRHMRRQEGIVDAELRHMIRGLRVGDHVQITLKTAAQAFHGETVVVRVTRIHGKGYCGKLIRSPVAAGLAPLRAGSRLAFTAAHIYAVPKGPAVDEPC